MLQVIISALFEGLANVAFVFTPFILGRLLVKYGIMGEE